MKKLMRVRDVVLARQSRVHPLGRQADDYRTEPPFKLQGSYRNMNRIAEKVVPIMNDQELRDADPVQLRERCPDADHRRRVEPAQVQGTDGHPLRDEAKRWRSIQRTYQENVRMHGIDQDDAVGQVVVQLRSFSDGLEAIREAVVDSVGDVLQQKQDTTLHDRVDRAGRGARQAGERRPGHQRHARSGTRRNCTKTARRPLPPWRPPAASRSGFTPEAGQEDRREPAEPGSPPRS